MTVPRVGASRARNLVLPCVLTPQLPPCAIAHLTPYSLTILSLFAFHHSHQALAVTLSFPHQPSPILATFLFHDVRNKTFSAHNTAEIGLDVRETGLFTHDRASLNFTIIPMCTPDVAMPCPCGAWQGCAMLIHHRTIGSSRSRTLVLPCFPTPQLPPCAIPHLTPDTLSILTLLAFHHSPDSLSIPLSFPHRPSPILVTFLSMTCVLKRFLLTSPRKLALTCVKRPVLRTAESTSLGRL